MGGVGEFGISWNRDFSILRKEEDLEIVCREGRDFLSLTHFFQLFFYVIYLFEIFIIYEV